MKMNSLAARLSIRAQLIIGFMAIILILLFATTVTLIKVNTAKRSLDHILMVNVPNYAESIDLYLHLYQLQTALSGWISTHQDTDKKAIDTAIHLIDKSKNQVDSFSKSWQAADQTRKWEEIKDLISHLQTISTQMLTTNNEAAVKMMTNDIIPTSNKIFDLLDGPLNREGIRNGGLLTVHAEENRQENHSVMKDVDIIEMTEYILMAAGVLVSLLIVIFTIRSIMNRVNSIKQKIIEDSHTIVATLDEVRTAVNLQTSGATEQASSINEITASLEEIEKSSSQTKEKAASLGESAQKTREQGQQGLDAVEQSIHGMKIIRDKVQIIAQTILDLSQQTQQVGEITAVVNNLAQQSKMLALNASIEAAKAGEAGKGFAVVASEVKNLAEQSEESTTQVQKILEDIRHATEKAVMVTEEGTKGVDYGKQLVEQTGEIVHKLNDVIYDTGIATQQIEAAVRQESVGIEQITLGMNEINHVTSSFVESVRQTTEAVENLSSLAKDMKEYIDSFKF